MQFKAGNTTALDASSLMMMSLLYAGHVMLVCNTALPTVTNSAYVFQGYREGTRKS